MGKWRKKKKKDKGENTNKVKPNNRSGQKIVDKKK